MSLAIRLFRGPQDAGDAYEPKSWEVGIDLGSTMSAVGFCSIPEYTKDLVCSDDIKQITNYPRGVAVHGEGKSPRYEVPTELFYPSGHGEILIGYQADRAKKSPRMHGTHISLFKPLFHDQEDSKQDLRQTAAAIASLPGSRTVDTITTDFLMRLIKHAKSEMLKARELGYDERDNVHLTCTVPAIWSLRAKRRILRAYGNACEQAGLRIGKEISIWSEPEAATAHVLSAGKDMPLKKNDTFIVLDAGGITMDIVTYKIIGLNPLRLQEVVAGEGEMCGATDLNRRFVDQVRERLSCERENFDARSNSMPFERIMQNLENEFENSLKINYDGSNDFVEYLTVYGLPPNESKGFTLNEIEIDRDHLEVVFEPVLATAWGLVKSQLEKAYRQNRKPTRLICVGGLACSQRFRLHMRNSIRYYVEMTQRLDIECIFPGCSDFAVASGAVCRSLNKCSVDEYKSRCSIAICQDEIYDPEAEPHRDATPEFDKYEQRDYVHDCVKVLLKPGDVIPASGRRETVHLHRTIDWNLDTETLSISILESDSNEIAPGFPLKDPKNKGFHHLEEEVSFKIDVARLRSKLPKKNPKDATKQLRKSSRIRKGNPWKNVDPPRPRTGDSQLNSHEVETSSSNPTSPSLNESTIMSEEPRDDYMWVNYQLEVEFKGMFINYELKCPDANESTKGQVSLVGCELWGAYDWNLN